VLIGYEVRLREEAHVGLGFAREVAALVKGPLV
jgi:hypothetical protein